MRKIKILIGILFFIILIIWIRVFNISTAEEYLERKKEVICVEIDDAEASIMVVNEINVEDCRENLISYNEDKQTFLYIDQNDQIIERAINGEITDDEAVLKYNSLRTGEASGIRNLQYISAEKNISFIYNDNLYCFDYMDGRHYKIIDSCIGSTWCNTYWIQSREKIYFIDYDESQQQKNLYIQNKQQERRLVEKGIKSFCANSDGTRLYCVQGYMVPNIFGFNTKYKLIEINLLNGTNSTLQEIDTDNFVLENIDNKFLLYVEETDEKEMAKVYQLDLQSGKTKCIYRTNKKVIGIVS